MQLAPVVQRVDSAIHWITQLILIALIRWIMVYPVDSAIHPLNNWGLEARDIIMTCKSLSGLTLQNILTTRLEIYNENTRNKDKLHVPFSRPQLFKGWIALSNG